MSENEYEWVHDWYNSGYHSSSPENDPEGHSSGTNRVIRGGNWNNSANNVRVANRNNNNIGFRLVLSPSSDHSADRRRD